MDIFNVRPLIRFSDSQDWIVIDFTVNSLVKQKRQKGFLMIEIQRQPKVPAVKDPYWKRSALQTKKSGKERIPWFLQTRSRDRETATTLCQSSKIVSSSAVDHLQNNWNKSHPSLSLSSLFFTIIAATNLGRHLVILYLQQLVHSYLFYNSKWNSPLQLPFCALQVHPKASFLSHQQGRCGLLLLLFLAWLEGCCWCCFGLKECSYCWTVHANCHLHDLYA